MSIEVLIRTAFEANALAYRSSAFSLRGPTGVIRIRFSAEVVSKYGWDLVCLRKVQTTDMGKKLYSIEATGIIRNEQLLTLFKDAGYADCFFFTAKAVVVKRERMNYSDPVFDPKTAELTIRLSVYPDVASSSLQKLNASLTSYVVIAKLSS